MVKKALPFLIFGLPAVISQTLVFVLLLQAGPGLNASWAALLGWQLMAALTAALFFAHATGNKSREHRNGMFIHAFCLCLFLPAGGQLLFLAMMLAPVMFPSAQRQTDPHIVQAPEFTPSLVSRYTHGTVARLRIKLGDQAAPDADRVAAMIAMRSLPLHDTGEMLSGLLSDPLEEIRLLAYGISNAAENAVTQKIIAASRAIQSAQSAREHTRLNSVLAELHWELIYQNLVQGELSRHTLDRVEHHAHAALTHDKDNASMWCLLGRCALLRDEVLQAEFLFLHAMKRDFPAPRLLPWLAEAAFMKHEYDRIPAMLAQLHGHPLSPVLQSTVRYWTQ